MAANGNTADPVGEPVPIITLANFGGATPGSVGEQELGNIISEWLVSCEPDDENEVAVGGPFCLDFPATLTPTQRKIIHQFCNQLGLPSESIGDGSSRHIRVKLLSNLEIPSTSQLRAAIEGKLEKKMGKISKGMSKIQSNLFLGSGRDAADFDTLASAGITMIVNVALEWHSKFNPAFKYHKIDLKDVATQTILPAFQDAVKVIGDEIDASTDAEPRRVLVHCVMGKSRSASIIMAYLVAHDKLTLEQAFQLTYNSRPMIRPNSGFMQQLIAWEMSIHDGKATMDVESWINRVGIHGSERHGLFLRNKKESPSSSSPQKQVVKVNDHPEGLNEFNNPVYYQNVLSTMAKKHFNNKMIGAFLVHLRSNLEQDELFKAALVKNHFMLSDALKFLQYHAKIWYLSNIDSNEQKG